MLAPAGLEWITMGAPPAALATCLLVTTLWVVCASRVRVGGRGIQEGTQQQKNIAANGNLRANIAVSLPALGALVPPYYDDFYRVCGKDNIPIRTGSSYALRGCPLMPARLFGVVSTSK